MPHTSLDKILDRKARRATPFVHGARNSGIAKASIDSNVDTAKKKLFFHETLGKNYQGSERTYYELGYLAGVAGRLVLGAGVGLCAGILGVYTALEYLM